MSPIDLLLCFGVCFGLMNKVPFLHGKSAFLDKLLKCSYCTGFHSGWICYLLTLNFHIPDSFVAFGTSLFLWSFVSSGFCYFADVLTQKLES